MLGNNSRLRDYTFDCWHNQIHVFVTFECRKRVESMAVFKKINTEFVSLENVDMSLDDLSGVDEQIRCILGDIESGFKEKKYNIFKIVVYGRKL